VSERVNREVPLYTNTTHWSVAIADLIDLYLSLSGNLLFLRDLLGQHLTRGKNINGSLIFKDVPLKTINRTSRMDSFTSKLTRQYRPNILFPKTLGVDGKTFGIYNSKNGGAATGAEWPMLVVQSDTATFTHRRAIYEQES
jgi:hypothetical protein